MKAAQQYIESQVSRALEVAVLRAEPPQVGFRWELRRYGRVAAVEAGQEVFGSASAAREAGRLALANLSEIESFGPLARRGGAPIKHSPDTDPE